MPMLNWWFGARWFGYRLDPFMKGIGFLRSTPIRIPNHQPLPWVFTHQIPVSSSFMFRGRIDQHLEGKHLQFRRRFHEILIGSWRDPNNSWSSWWLNQPICKICSSNWIISPGIGVKIQNVWNHHLVIYTYLGSMILSLYIYLAKVLVTAHPFLGQREIFFVGREFMGY